MIIFPINQLQQLSLALLLPFFILCVTLRAFSQSIHLICIPPFVGDGAH